MSTCCKVRRRRAGPQAWRSRGEQRREEEAGPRSPARPSGLGEGSSRRVYLLKAAGITLGREISSAGHGRGPTGRQGRRWRGGGGSSPAAGERGPASGTHVSPFVTARVSGPGSSRGGRAPPVRARSRGSVRGPPRPGGSRRGKDGSRGRGDEPGPGAGSGAAAGSPGSSGQAPPRTARGPRVWLCAGRRKHSGPEHPFGPSFRPSAGRAAAGPAPAPSGAWLLGAVAGGSQRSVSPWRNSRATCLCFSSALRKRTDGVLQRESSRVRL